jgi:hypothetical protein
VLRAPPSGPAGQIRWRRHEILLQDQLDGAWNYTRRSSRSMHSAESDPFGRGLVPLG